MRHVLSHTAGYLNSGSGAKDGAAEHFGVSVDDVTAAQHHQAVLLGTDGAPFLSDPGTIEKYSNHGFSVAGLLIEEASDEGSYREYVEQHLLEPLGLTDVVPNNAELGALDTVPHSSDGDPLDVDPTVISRLGLSTGGWTASARDLARIMCSTDQTADNLRSLEPATVVEMAADAVASAPGVNPLGWDSSNGTEMTKNGSISGGTSRISKFLPGAFDGTDDEINVAVAVNQSGATPPASLLRNIAQVAADASVPATYDLFDAGPPVPHPARPDDRRAGPARQAGADRPDQRSSRRARRAQRAQARGSERRPEQELNTNPTGPPMACPSAARRGASLLNTGISTVRPSPRRGIGSAAGGALVGHVDGMTRGMDLALAIRLAGARPEHRRAAAQQQGCEVQVQLVDETRLDRLADDVPAAHDHDVTIGGGAPSLVDGSRQAGRRRSPAGPAPARVGRRPGASG